MIIKKYKLLKLYNQTYHVLFFIVIFCLIYILYPKQAKFKYEFQKGSPWKHEDLISPFDFPILKEKEVYDTEKDSLLKIIKQLNIINEESIKIEENEEYLVFGSFLVVEKFLTLIGFNDKS